jgi:hypothetical protein
MGKNGEVRLSQFFYKNGIYLLKHPREKLNPGTVFKSEQDDIHLQQFGKLTTILQHKEDTSREYRLPPIETDSPEETLAGAIKNETNINIAVEFFQNLFDKFLGLAIGGKASNQSILSATYKISGLSTDSIEPAELIDSVGNYVVKDNFQLNYSNSNYYIVNKTWYCKSLQIILGNLTQTEIHLLAEALKNKLGIEFTNMSGNIHSINCDKKVAFGINVARLNFYRPTEKTEINIVPHDTHLEALTEEESIPFKDIDSEPTE